MNETKLNYFMFNKSLNEPCNVHIFSNYVFYQARKINIYFTILIIIVGLIGNGLAVYVFSFKKYRIDSSCIYLLSLSVSDGLFLLTHFFEDTLRAYIDHYLNKNDDLHQLCALYNSNNMSGNNYSTTTLISEPNQHILRQVNLTDRFDFFCKLFNYFRYCLRFVSAYIIVAFTVHRFLALYFPYTQKKLLSKQFSWMIILIISIVGIVSNMWVPFLFKAGVFQGINHISYKYCDIQRDYSSSYFIITIVYIVIVMLVPIVTIFVCNTCIIRTVFAANKTRKLLLIEAFSSNNNSPNNVTPKQMEKIVRFRQVQIEKTVSKNSSRNGRRGELMMCSQNTELAQQICQSNRKSIQEKKINLILITVSFVYAVLNLPYFISWSMFYYEAAFNQKNIDPNTQLEAATRKNFLFAGINVSEIFYVLNYGIHFFIYCASGRRFRHQLKAALNILEQICSI